MRERFDSKWVADPETGCHLWTDWRTDQGYGYFSAGRRFRKGAHVFAWFFANGRWPEQGEVVRHDCDNPPCVNPAHLQIGTKADNERDKVARGRHHNQLKEACVNGHSYAEHGGINGRGKRYCVTCKREQGVAYLRRKATGRTAPATVTEDDLRRCAELTGASA